jgi:hypothetical protein
VDNYFVVGADQRLDRDALNRDPLVEQPGETFRISYPTLSPNSTEVQILSRDLSLTQIVNTQTFSQTSTGHLVMRLHFLVTSYLNLYLEDKKSKEVILGHSLSQEGLKHPYGARWWTVADKRCHLMTVDKVVAHMHVGDTFLEHEDQVQDRVITQYKRDEAMWISDFDGFMPLGNPFLRKTQSG